MRILITGGSGFLARGIMRQWPQYQYVVFSRDEYKQDLARQQYPDAKYVLGDVKDYERLVQTIKSCQVDTIIHTAAVKFIPEAELNVQECIDVNVDGTRNVLQAAYDLDVENVIGISTDKAVMPINTYGMTKALMERLFVEFSRLDPERHYALVRYGNVIGSTGSVIPAFERQLKETGRLRITDPDMSRYWITIEQAVWLIGLALEHNSGSIIIPRPRSMNLMDLALAVSGGSNNIDVVGPRLGEKKHEQLMHAQESVRAVSHHQYYELCATGVHSEPFILSSNTPEAGWFDVSEMQEAVMRARAV